MGAKELFKEATRLKKEKRYDEACQTLRVAYQSADVGEYIDIRERLRLPVYLCFADKNDEAWAELNRLASTYIDPINQIAIRTMMKKFLEDEGRIRDAIFTSVWVYILSLKYYIGVITDIHHQADAMANEEPLRFENEDGSVYELDFRRMDIGRTPFAYTANGSPIFDVAHNHMLESLNRKLDIDIIESEFESLCTKLCRPDLPPAIADKILEIIEDGDESGEWVGYLHEFFRKQLMD